MNKDDIKSKLKEAYNLLEDGSKKRATDIHGVTPAYFRRIVGGAVKDESVYYSALNACKQASSEHLENAKKSHKEINGIHPVFEESTAV